MRKRLRSGIPAAIQPAIIVVGSRRYDATPPFGARGHGWPAIAFSMPGPPVECEANPGGRRREKWGDGRLTLGIREMATAPPSGRTRSPAVEVVRHITACPDIHPQGRTPCAPPRKKPCPDRRNLTEPDSGLVLQNRSGAASPDFKKSRAMASLSLMPYSLTKKSTSRRSTASWE